MVSIGPVSVPEYGLSYKSDNIQLKIGEKILGPGTLCITQNALCWQPNNIADGISFYWKQISVHGIATEPKKCIYFMVDQHLNWPGVYETTNTFTTNGHGIRKNDGEGDVSDDQDEDEEEEDIFQDAEEEQLTECWLIPDDINTVDTMFHAMAECQALHPDPADSISDESNYMDDDNEEVEEETLGNVVENTESVMSEAQGAIRDLNLNDNPQFADADE